MSRSSLGSSSAAELDPAASQEAIDIQPGEAATGAVALVRSDGENGQGTSGDTQTGLPVVEHAHFRIGSISKTFEAVVLLQLAGEHRVELDQSVQHYLPGLLPADFQPITVRELLDIALNYRIIGLLIERITGHSFKDEATGGSGLLRPRHRHRQ